MPGHEDEQQRKRLLAEQLALREAIATITLAWSHLENDLALVLSNLMHDPSGDLAFAIYFAPTSSETRIKIVDVAFDTLAHTSVHKERIMEAWCRTIGRVNRLKVTRNAVAHGMITTVGHNKKNHVRLTAPIFDFRRHAPAFAKRQLPGLSSNDINISARQMSETGKILMHFVKISDALRRRDEPTLLGTLLLAEADLKKATLPQGGQKKPTPGSPPQSSRE